MENKIADFVQVVRRRNVRETVAGLIILPFFTVELSRRREPTLTTAGMALVVLAVLIILAVTWGKLHIPKSELSEYPPAQHPDRWRGHLSNQARLLRLAWLWYVLPLLTGVLLVFLGSGGDLSPGHLVAAGIVAVLAVGIAWLNVQAARGIERDCDAWLGVRTSTSS